MGAFVPRGMTSEQVKFALSAYLKMTSVVNAENPLTYTIVHTDPDTGRQTTIHFQDMIRGAMEEIEHLEKALQSYG